MISSTDAEKRNEYRKALCKNWYSLSGVESTRHTIANDESLDENIQYELLQLIDRRIVQIVDARLEPEQ